MAADVVPTVEQATTVEVEAVQDLDGAVWIVVRGFVESGVLSFGVDLDQAVALGEGIARIARKTNEAVQP